MNTTNQHPTQSHKATKKENVNIETPKDFDVVKVREEFPILSTFVHDKPLVYLDNAATTQKPLVVIETLDNYYRKQNANIHRGVHFLSEQATQVYECVRIKIQKFINAADSKEIIFTRGTTEGINLVAQTWGRAHLKPGDEVLITGMEHHSNIVPWQMVCDEMGAKLKVIPITDEGDLNLKNISDLLSPKTKMLALTQVSNALGTVNPVAELIRLAHEKGAKVLVDGAQAVSHMTVDVRVLDCDFYAFSGHKLYGPTGIGVLYGKYALLDSMPPYQGGGDMISSVTFEKTLYKKPPHKFEAGTPAIAEVIGLGSALDYVSHIGLPVIAAHEEILLAYGTKVLKRVPGLTLIGTSTHKAGVLSFTLGEIHPHDLGTILDQEGVAIRAGHHCAQPVMDRYGISATARASLALYNTMQDLDALVIGLNKALELFG